MASDAAAPSPHLWKFCRQVKPQAPFSQVALALAGTEQGEHEVPHENVAHAIGIAWNQGFGRLEPEISPIAAQRRFGARRCRDDHRLHIAHEYIDLFVGVEQRGVEV